MQPRHVRRTVRRDLLDRDDHHARRPGKQLALEAVVVDGRAAVDAQSAAVREVDEQEAHARVLEDVAQAHEQVVAVEIRKGERARVEHTHQSRPAALEGAVALTTGIARREEEERPQLDARVIFGRNVIEEQPREARRLAALGAPPAALRLALTRSEHGFLQEKGVGIPAAHTPVNLGTHSYGRIKERGPS
jgi:hypothetical protein